MEFIKYNANPKGWDTGDCVIRAISAATQKTWEETYDALDKIGRHKYRLPNDTHVYKEYLKNYYFIEEKQMKHSNGTKYMIDELIDEYPDDILLIHCTHHLTCAIQGNLVDTWNCRYKVAGKYWRLPKEYFDESDIERYVEWLKENRVVKKVRL